jgi:ABC-type nitrate/sulfonate/bicarbonate transport system permease component
MSTPIATASAAPEPLARARWRPRLGGVALAALGLAVFLALWELAPRLGLVNPLMLPRSGQATGSPPYVPASGITRWAWRSAPRSASRSGR